VLKERKPPPRRLISTKIDPGSNPDSDPDVCQIAAKMLWMHYHVGVSHFAEWRDNRPVTVWEMLINLLKCPITQWWGKRKSDTKSVSGTGSPPKVYYFFRLVTPSFNEIVWLLLLLTEWLTERENDSQTDLIASALAELMTKPAL